MPEETSSGQLWPRCSVSLSISLTDNWCSVIQDLGGNCGSMIPEAARVHPSRRVTKTYLRSYKPIGSRSRWPTFLPGCTFERKNAKKEAIELVVFFNRTLAEGTARPWISQLFNPLPTRLRVRWKCKLGRPVSYLKRLIDRQNDSMPGWKHQYLLIY